MQKCEMVEWDDTILIASFPGTTAQHFFALWKNTVFFKIAKNAGNEATNLILILL